MRRRLFVLALVVIAYAVATATARSLGYKVGGKTVVRCRDGHVFTTVWVPGLSLKSVRLGPWRVQRCPIGPHLTIVHPVREEDLTGPEREIALELLDTPVP